MGSRGRRIDGLRPFGATGYMLPVGQSPRARASRGEGEEGQREPRAGAWRPRERPRAVPRRTVHRRTQRRIVSCHRLSRREPSMRIITY